MRHLLISFVLATLSWSVCYPKTTQRTITLQEALDIAQEQSLEIQDATNALCKAYWEYRSFRATMLPNVVLDGTLPSYNKSLSAYQLEDGSYNFITNNSLSENLSLAVTQNIPLTGGTISVGTELQRIDIIGSRSTTNYLAIPAVLTFQQPILSFNSMKWNRKIEPTKYTAAKKQYAADIEYVSVLTVNYYFDLLLAQVNLNIAKQNLKNSTALYNIAEEKKKLGLISDNDLQQLRVGKLNASASIVKVEQDHQEKMQALRNFLRLPGDIIIEPVIPEDIPHVNLNEDEVWRIVNKNNPFTENIKLRLIETEKQIAFARSERGFRMDVYASIGFTGTNKQMSRAFENLQNRQIVTVGIKIPILDWGTGKGKVEVARAKQRLEIGKTEQDTRDFELDVKMLVSRLQSQPYLMDIYLEADTVAQNRYKIAFETFIMGKINVLDINAAQTEEDDAKRNYIGQLYYSWYYFYRLRQLSLYDFVYNCDIINDLSESKWIKRFLKK